MRERFKYLGSIIADKGGYETNLNLQWVPDGEIGRNISLCDPCLGDGEVEAEGP